MEHGEQDGVVGLGLDGDPFRGVGAGHGQVRLKLNPLHAALAGVGVAAHPGHPAGGVDVAAEGDQILATGGVRQNGEGPVPQLAEHVFRVVALDRAAGPQALIERPPGEQQGRKTAHVLEGRRRAPRGEGQARVAVLVQHALGPGRVHLVRHQVQGLLPADLHPARILVPALFRVGALHGPLDAVGVVEFLHQPEGFDADLAVGGMLALEIEVGFHLGGHPIHRLHGQQIRPVDALVAISGDSLDDRFNIGRHNGSPRHGRLQRLQRSIA